MLIEDRLYGKFEIDSLVLVELINSPAVQRLKGINQLGVPAKFYPFPSFSRYEHSIGVMLLLRRLGASEEEQIAGLLHDASHTAFSHVIDWVIKEIGGQESFQDENHLTYLKGTELPLILEKFGYDVKTIADHHRFGLLERDIPNLCADRVDYSLREFTDDTSQACLSGLTVNNGFIAFNDKGLAKLFAENFLERQKLNWGGFEAVNRYYYFAKALRIAMELGLVRFEDFYKDDDYVMNLIKDCQDEEFKKIMAAMQEKYWANRPQTGRRMEKKVRYVDPLCTCENGLQNLSLLDSDFKNKLKEELAIQKPGVPIVIL